MRAWPLSKKSTLSLLMQLETGGSMQTATVFQLKPHQEKRERRSGSRQLLFEQMVHFAPDVIFVADLDGRFSFVNDQAHELTGYTKTELIGMRFTELVAPTYRSRVFRFYARQYLTGRHGTTLEFPIITKSGTMVWIEQNVSFQRIDHFPMFLAIARDITAKKETELALEESERMNRALFDNSVQAMFRSTPDGRIVSANRSLLRLLRYSSFEELASVDLPDLYADPEDRQTLMALLREKGYCRNIEFSLKRKDGKTITVSEYSRAIKNQQGEIVLFEGALEDISLRKAYEATTAEYVASIQESEKELKELIAQKDRLFSVLSHDLRSPFASILGFCDLLLDESDSVSHEEQREFVGYIKEAATAQLSLVNRLLQWSRLESDRFQTTIHDVNLAEVIEKSINGLRGLSL
jgi:PAS domain S-box-containing protein